MESGSFTGTNIYGVLMPDDSDKADTDFLFASGAITIAINQKPFFPDPYAFYHGFNNLWHEFRKLFHGLTEFIPC